MWHSHDKDGRHNGHEGPSGPGAPEGFGPPWARHNGFGPRGARGFGPGPWGPPGRRGPRGGRSRGDVRTAILLLLAEQPRHGYDLIRAIEERSDGMWSPSPGSVYPTLQALEDEGLLTIDKVEGRKTASLTDLGTAWVTEHADLTASVFDRPKGADGVVALREQMGALAEAAMHVAHGPTNPERVEKAAEILASARKELYRLMADDD